MMLASPFTEKFCYNSFYYLGRWATKQYFTDPGSCIALSLVRSKKKTQKGIVMQRYQHYPSISVVIPTYNEAQNLPHVLPYIPAMVTEIILVDGNSTDMTVTVAQELLPTIRVIQQKGKGKGDALRTAFAACTGDIIVTLDADGSSDPKEILRFVDVLQWGYDFAKGSRFLTGGNSHDISFLRGLGNRGLSSVVNILFGTRFSDLCYGYNAFWKHCLDYVDIDCDGFEVEAQINLRMHKANLKIVEVPSFEHRRRHGESKLHPLRDGWRVLCTILKEWRSFDTSPPQLQQPEVPLNPPTLLPDANVQPLPLHDPTTGEQHDGGTLADNQWK